MTLNGFFFFFYYYFQMNKWYFLVVREDKRKIRKLESFLILEGKGLPNKAMIRGVGIRVLWLNGRGDGI
jgi:hypothetical protein